MRLLILNLLLCSACSLFSQDMPKNQTAHSLETAVTKEVKLRYLLFLPEGYSEKKTNKWPLLLFLHGAGERGTNLAAVAVHGPPKVVKTRPDFPFIVVSPQCPSGGRWQTDSVLALLDSVLAEYNVDESRVYLTGLSMGGFGTWSLAASHPERFAAVAPICGGGDVIDLLLAPPAKAKALKTLPVWAFHGAKDDVVKLSESERMVAAHKRLGAEAKLTVYPEAGHDSWTATYANQELYDWFLKHSREVSEPKKGKQRAKKDS